MPLYRQRELHDFLNRIGASPQKTLSQNFLIDGNIVDKIVEESFLSQKDCVLEIGPGPGVLTEALVKTGCRIIAVEKDPLFAHHLPRLGTSIEVIKGDFLKQDLPSLIPSNTKVVANLPYHLTSPILNKLFESSFLFNHLLLMVQKEVAERIVAPLNTKAYGALSIFCQFFTVPKIAIRVKSTCFFPKPKVDSAVVAFTMKEKTPNLDRAKFFHFIRSLFSFRRKMISSSLKRIFNPQLTSYLIQHAGLNGTERCEKLSLDQFIQLFQAIPESSTPTTLKHPAPPTKGLSNVHEEKDPG